MSLPSEEQGVASNNGYTFCRIECRLGDRSRVRQMISHSALLISELGTDTETSHWTVHCYTVVIAFTHQSISLQLCFPCYKFWSFYINKPFDYLQPGNVELLALETDCMFFLMRI